MRSTRPPRGPLKRLAVLAAALFAALLVLVPHVALAAGTVTLASREPTEVDGKWKLNMTIDYGSIPPIPHIPMIFSFQPTVLYERSLTDKSPEKPVLIRMPLQNQQSINESMDVGFADASGKVFKVTKFDFVIRRDHGFEAGEYDLKIKRQDDGAQMGQTIKLILKGDNPVVDRRAIVFAGEKKPKKVDADKGKDEKKDEAKPEEKKDEPKTEEPAADPSAAAPPPVPPKQGGCGCEVAGEEGVNPLGAVAGLALVALVMARRRKAA